MKNLLKIFIIFIAVAFAIIFLVSVNVVPINEGPFKDPYSLYYAGDVRHFRADLFEANKTVVYPDEEAVKNVLLNPDVYKITIAYIPNETENANYLASSFEITNKLGLVYRSYFNEKPSVFKDEDGSSCMLFFQEKQTKCFKSLPVNLTGDLVSTDVEPVILLLGPSRTNQTGVTVKDNLIILEGKDFSQVNRNYNDLDLVVDKMLLVLMLSKD
jgi:hypothetical protein